MAYVAWSVVFGEQPTAAKWNILGTNDASFHDGTGIDDDAILTRHVLDANITTNKLSTSAINLGYAETTSNQAALTSATPVDLTGLSTTITAPASRKIRIEGLVGFTQSTVSGVLLLRIMEGATVLQEVQVNPNGTSITRELCVISRELTASAGSHTYKLMGANMFASGNVTVVAAATTPNYISVKAI